MANRMDTLQTRRLAGGLSVGDLARQANVTDWTIQALENGGACDPVVTQRIVDALAAPVALTSNSQANPTSFTTTTTHTFQTNDSVTIAGVTGANADPNGTRTATRVSGTAFTVPVNCSTAGGTGGTATLRSASVGLASLT